MDGKLYSHEDFQFCSTYHSSSNITYLLTQIFEIDQQPVDIINMCQQWKYQDFLFMDVKVNTEKDLEFLR